MASRPVRLRVVATSTLLTALLATFALELARGAVGVDRGLLALGALPDRGGLHGAYWRLLTFGFLHSGWGHLLANSGLLLLTGPVVERRAGSPRVLLVFATASIVSGVAIMTKHALRPSVGVSVGASGGMFGLLGAALVLAYRRVPHRRWLRVALLAAAAVGFAYSALPGISLVGHIVGFGVGLALGWPGPDPEAGRGPEGLEASPQTAARRAAT